jgi:hypothetical protein
MNNKLDGGPAFPFTAECDETAFNQVLSTGMTLRDYFAAAALTGYLSYGASMNNAAIWSYESADKMLKLREDYNKY